MSKARLLMVVSLLLFCNAGYGADEPVPAHPDDLVFPERTTAFPAAEDFLLPLPHGGSAILFPDDTLPLFEISLVVPAGRRFDPEGHTGLAYLTATLLRRGGAGRHEPTAFEDYLDLLGFEVDTVSRFDRAGISIQGSFSNLEPAVELLCDTAYRPRFEAEALEDAKQQLLALMPHRFDTPLARAQMEWQRLVFGESSPRARDLTTASLMAIDREDLIAFHRRYWHSSEPLVALSGYIEQQEFLKLWQRHCGIGKTSKIGEASGSDETRGPKDDEINKTPPIPAKKNGKKDGKAARPGLYHLERDLPQTLILLGHSLPALAWGHEDRPGLRVLAEILGGGGAVARLGGRLRSAEGLTYQVTTELDLDIGTFSALFETNGPNTARALSLAIEEIERLRREPLGAEEFRIARSEVLLPQRLAFDSAEQAAGHLADDLFQDRLGPWRNELDEELAQLRPKDVRRLAQRYLDPKALIVVTVGRWSEIERGAQLDNLVLDRRLGPVVHLPWRDPMTLRMDGDNIPRP